MYMIFKKKLFLKEVGMVCVVPYSGLVGVGCSGVVGGGGVGRNQEMVVYDL